MANTNGQSVWSGSITLGTLNVPVKLTPCAGADEGVRLHELTETGEGFVPVTRQRVTPDGEPVHYSDVRKGYDTGDGYVLVSTEDVAGCQPERTKRIQLDGFRRLDAIPLRYFDKPYWIRPADGGEHQYALLVAALKRAGLAATGTYVMRTREYPVVVYPEGDMLVAANLYWPAELRDAPTLNLPQPSKAEVDVAVKIVRLMAEDGWDEARYVNQFDAALRALVERRMGDRVWLVGQERRQDKPAGDLIAALEAELAKTTTTKAAPKARGKKVTA